MAIKGLIDNSVYVVGTYTDTDYTAPARSVGDYTTQDYVAFDYLLEGLDLSSNFTLFAQVTIEFGYATLNNTFTLSAQPTKIKQGSASFTAFTAQVQLAGELFYGEPPDITWDSFAESAFIDRTWDEWYGDAWEQGGVLFAVSTVFKALGGYRVFASTSVDSEFTQQQNITIGISKSITSTATQEVNGNYTAFGSGSYDSVFEQADVFFDRFRGVAIDGTPYERSAIFSQTANANALFDPTNSYDTAVTTQQNANVLFDLGYGQLHSAAFTHSANGNALFDLKYGELFEAFNTQLTIGRIIALPDPWNILSVKQEIRTLLVPIELRSLPVNQETRVNSIEPELRSIQVPQETRSYKIFKPQFTNRSSIPRVRQEP
jgi:hypothetical protein